jgi:FkbM family methyltransferase
MGRDPEWFRHRLDAPSHAKYLLWRALERAGWSRAEVVVRLKGGPRLLLRGRPARDLDTAYELFQQEVYRFAVDRAGDDVRWIVDLGANAGFSLTYFAWNFPRAHFVVFEPNPALLRALYRNVQLNGLESRVTIHPTAACASHGDIELSDEESESSVLPRPGARRITVCGEDLFEALAGVRVDLLKMDIEGAEHRLLSDARFAALKPRSIVMEWHSTDEHPEGQRRCVESLESLGYTVKSYLDLGPRTGMIYASGA